MLRVIKLTLAAATATIALAQAAQAAPLYGVVSDAISGFTIGGSSVTGVTVGGPIPSNYFTEAHLPGSDVDQHGFGDPDPVQAKVGAGPFPPENTFSAQGHIGTFGRADLAIDTRAAGGSFNQIAELNAVTGTGLTWAWAAGSTTYTVARSGAGTVEISFSAHPFIQSDGGFEVTQDIFVSIADLTDTPYPTHPVLLWQPNGAATVNTGGFGVGTGWNVSEVDPFTLNTSTRDLVPLSYDPGTGLFSLSFEPPAGHTVQVIFGGMSNLFRSETIPPTVPEPASALLLLAGLVPGLISRRRPTGAAPAVA